MVRLPNGDQWNPVGTPRRDTVDATPEPKVEDVEDLLLKDSGIKHCPWCGVSVDSMDETLAEHVEQMHARDIGDDVLEARAVLLGK